MECRTLAVDFSKPAAEWKALAQKAVDELEVGVLVRVAQSLAGSKAHRLKVNNVGASYPGALFFDELATIDPTLTERIIRLNVIATTFMTEIVVKQMVRMLISSCVVC